MAVNNSLANRPQKGSLTAYLNADAVKNQINNVIGGKNGKRFIASVVSAVQATPALQECTNPSILSAALLGESLNLSPSPQLGQYYMVPYKCKEKRDREGNIIEPECKKAQFQLGYKGYIQLAIRSGQYRKLNVLAIKEGELEYFDPLNEEIKVNLMVDNWDERDKAPTIGYYAMFEYTNGFRKAMYWSKAQMLAHADQYSQAFSKNAYQKILAGEIPERDMWRFSSFWYKDFDGMAYKTMLRQLISKWGIMSIDMISAMESDMGVIREDGTVDYVDNAPEEYIAAEADFMEQEQSLDPEPQQHAPVPEQVELDQFF